MQFEFSALTDVGRHRKNNEDAVLIEADHGLVILADGMGGYNAGEVASALAVDVIARELKPGLTKSGEFVDVRSLRRAMEVCVSNANRAIFEAAQTQEACAGMGTTLVMAASLGQSLLIGHAGDSRAYRWREGVLMQLTRDHSLLQEQLDSGLITAEQAAVSPHRNLVTRALGVEENVLLDIQAFNVLPGDTYLLCSDGLTDMLTDSQIAEVLTAVPQADLRATRLVERANANGGHDNVTVALMQVVEMPKKSGFVAKLRKY
ncbi:Stp1/IreP family PP2C-type Ser/Thr phosphatase [Ottowia thiooxydans]|uniref:Stp1/IreP family PP2C-type Ser/Thr phosphatase n=1 Tax=Ottowia thiooxydans TaxID=219182 RepID=UPI000490441B|nr:Stp1/IreP family PP2C-type Ser/Thr phosphatase [Ottowia thiooxydans]